ncbi:MAG: hypothetical protein QM778_18555 [Myxococcales bacterium]
MKALTASAALLVVAGCYPAEAPAPVPVGPEALQVATTRWPDSTSESLDAGWSLFLDSCNKCHGYPDVHKVDADAWPSTTRRMGKKAHLDDAQTELLLRYILAEQAGGIAPQSCPLDEQVE